MKTKILLCAFAFVVAYSSTAQEQSNETKTDTAKPKTAIVKIEEGSLLKVKSLSEISSKTASEGTTVKGYIDEAEKAKSVGKQGTLRIQFDFTKAVDGTKIPLRSTRGSVEGDDKTTTSVALAVVVSPLFLLKKGKEAKIPAGKIMDAYVARDVEITVVE
jgi:hypothetical protein